MIKHWSLEVLGKGPFPGGSVVKNLSAMQETPVQSVGQEDPIPVFLPGKSHGQRSLAVYTSWSLKRVGRDFATTQQQQILKIMRQN